MGKIEKTRHHELRMLLLIRSNQRSQTLLSGWINSTVIKVDRMVLTSSKALNYNKRDALNLFPVLSYFFCYSYSTTMNSIWEWKDIWSQLESKNVQREPNYALHISWNNLHFGDLYNSTSGYSQFLQKVPS